MTWAWYYTDFPVVRITDTAALARPAAPVRGPRAMLVHDDEAVFLGGWGDPYGVHAGRLRNGTVGAPEPLAVLGPTGFPLKKFRVVSTRGSRLFLWAGDRLLEADIASPLDLRPV